jgi:UDP-N-acetylglucosamine 4,6-dehydratase
MQTLAEKVVLVTGGTGSFGHRFVETVLAGNKLKKLIVFSRDELKQFEMRSKFKNHPKLRFFIGDVRDPDRLRRAMEEVDIVVHAAAMKRVEVCEYNPIEAILTNVIGARNVIEAAMDSGVDRVMALSTDKAVNPINLYGATKLCSEKLFIQSNSYSGAKDTRFSCVRYGNVVGSRGSVVEVFRSQQQNGSVTVTDPRMTRFWISLDQGVSFVISCLSEMAGGEVFVPKIPSMNIMDLVQSIAPAAEVDKVGIGSGEKLHEVLLSEDEARQALEFDDKFVVLPDHPFWNGQKRWQNGRPLADGFRYASDTNTEWLSIEQLRDLVGSEQGT